MLQINRVAVAPKCNGVKGQQRVLRIMCPHGTKSSLEVICYTD